MAELQNAVFWIEVDKISPNPFQPRREFDPENLKDLAESIKQYGVLQPLVVSRHEDPHEDGSILVNYELIAGERRLRAAKLALVKEVPCVVRIGDDSRTKLELAIIENLQREDLNAVDRARSFQQLADEFKLSWVEVAKKIGKSREYVSNTVRILMLPQEILDALIAGKISEGHTRPLLMLVDKPAEQITLFKEMLMRKMTVREAEKLARRVAYEKIRKRSLMANPEVVDLEERLAESLGTRVHIEPKERGGKITIDYFSHDELLALAQLIKKAGKDKIHIGMFDKIRNEMHLEANSPLASAMVTHIEDTEKIPDFIAESNRDMSDAKHTHTLPQVIEEEAHTGSLIKEPVRELQINSERELVLENKEESQDLGEESILMDDRSKEEIRAFEERENDLYDLKNFSL